MNILWLSHLVPYPPKGGVLQRAHQLLKEVAKYHDVDLLAFHQPNLMRPLFANLDDGIAESEEVLSSFCNSVEFVQIDSEQQPFGQHRLALKSLITSDPYTINWLKSEAFTRALNKLLQENDYDLVHLDTISLQPYFKYVKHLATVLDHHNIESHMLLRRAEKENNAFKKWYFRQEGKRLEKFEKSLCPQVSLNITCSEMDRQRLFEIVPGCHVEEIPNGVDIEYFKPDASVEQKKSLIFIGTLDWYPNIEAVRFIAYEIWPLLKKNIPDITLDIIGAGPPADIMELSQKDESFKVHGFVDDILPYLDKAAVYVCPIMDGGGTKLKILDALAMEKAIVAHEIACEGINVVNGENVIFAQTAEAYVDAISSLIENKELRLSMGQSARQLIEAEYAYEKVGRKLSDLYQQCLLTASSETIAGQENR